MYQSVYNKPITVRRGMREMQRPKDPEEVDIDEALSKLTQLFRERGHERQGFGDITTATALGRAST